MSLWWRVLFRVTTSRYSCSASVERYLHHELATYIAQQHVCGEEYDHVFYLITDPKAQSDLRILIAAFNGTLTRLSTLSLTMR